MPTSLTDHTQDENRGVPETENSGPDAIARRAYDRFQSRGGEHGRHEEEWLEAERELNMTFMVFRLLLHT